MKWSELKRIAKDNGWYLTRQGGRHEIYKHPTIKEQIEMGRHDNKEVPTGTATKILKQIKGK